MSSTCFLSILLGRASHRLHSLCPLAYTQINTYLCSSPYLSAPLRLLTRPCIWGGRTSRRSTCRWFSLQSPHSTFFTCRLSINIPCTCASRMRYSSHCSSASHNRSQAKRSCCCCSSKAVHEISLLTQVLLWHFAE